MKFKTFYFLMQLIFIVGKMLGMVAWPWLIVFSPLWLPIAIVVIFCTLGSVDLESKNE